MPEIREIDCPNCGSSLQILNAQRVKTLVCNTCGSHIDVTDPNLGIIGQFLQGQAPPRTPIALGMNGAFDETYQVIGRIRYRDQEAWDEWLMMTVEGRFKWLSEGREGFSIWEPFVPTNPIDLNTLGPYEQIVGRPLNLEGTEARITDRGTGTVEFIEGEMTWKARANDQMQYLEAESGADRYSVEWSRDEVEFFRGRRLDANTVRRAFGLPEIAVAAPARGGRSRAWLIAVIVIVVCVLLCICIAIASADSGSSGSGGGGGGPVFIPVPSGGSSGGRSGGGSSGSSGGGSIRGGSSGGRSGGGGSSGGGGGK